MFRNSTPCVFLRKLIISILILQVGASALAQNVIVTENQLPGNPASEWDISDGAGSLTLQGFATDISVNRGNRINFKISTSTVFSYTIRVYRLGYYQGNGARLAADLGTFSGTVQPAPISDAQTGLVDCGNWSVSAFWDVPANAVSGLYIARLTRTDNTSIASHIAFVVRDDASTSDIFFQTSDATWQAYNNYGGNSLYVGSTNYPSGHATKVSYNRPFLTRDGGGGGGASQDWLFNAEYPMIRFLERNGYNISYTTNVDAARRGNLILNHKIFLSVGHDEYWSAEQRTNVEAARNAGVHLAFFSGNEVYWKTRWEPSTDGTNTDYRTLVCYKEGTLGENVCGGKCDPTNIWTGLWRDGCAFPGTGGCQPENALTGEISWGEAYDAIKVPSTYKNLRFWRNTSVASLANGQTATMPLGTLGYEWDFEQFQSSNPSGRITLSSTTVGGKTHKLSLYRHSSGALVFGAGTVQWSWGLDSNHDLGNAAPSTAMQQATVNLFADMGVQAGSLMSGMVAATASTDQTAPSSVIASPGNGTSVTANTPVTISGTSADNGGGVLVGVELSLDGGATWQLLSGTSSWSYSWTPTVAGTVNIKVRGFDDSGNMEVPGSNGASNNITVTVTSSSAFTGTIFQSTSTPLVARDNDGTAIEVGMKFRASQAGFITGIRYYKGAGTTGTHVGNLWTSTGTLLATVTFTGETSSGWQQALFSNPVAITANTTYVASYFSPSGDYSDTNPFFTQAVVNGPLRALANGEDGPNGLYRYTSTSAFPNSNFQSSNYFVDVVFTSNDATPPTVSQVSPANGSTGIPIATSITATFSEAVNAATVTGTTFVIKDASNNTIPATINTSSNQSTLTPSSPLAYSTAYTVTITGGSSGVKDLAGNALASNYSWSFTTVGGDVTPPTVNTVSPGQGATGVATTTPVSATFSEAVNPTTVTVTSFTLKDGSNNTVNATVTTSGSQVTLTPSAQLMGSTTYTASLAGGAYGIKDLAGNSLSSNYSWSFTTALVDLTPPTVVSVSPVSGATNVSLNPVITATFSETLNASTVTATTVQLRDAGNNLVSATVSGSGSQVTLTPLAALSGSTNYTVTITGGSSGVKDLAGNALVSNYSWPFTTTAITNYTIFQPTNIPSSQRDNDGTAIEVGMKFRSSQAGLINGVRYYKGSGTTGTHIGNLWTSTGTLLASVTFTGETASGWQQALFNTPVAINANTTYVVSYFSPSGDYADNNPYFTQAVVNGPLRALANGEDGPNGLYRYTSTSAFPNSNFQSSNYWVDVVFGTASADMTPPTVAAVNPVNAASNVSVSTPVTITFSEPIGTGSVTSSTVQLRDAGSNLIASSLGTNGSQVTLTPNAALSGTTTYTLTVTGGASGVKDLAGNALVNNFTSTFTTADNIPPTVSSTAPANGTTNIPAGTTVAATFSEAINPSTVTGTTFQLKDAGNNLVNATISTTGSQVTMTPTSPLNNFTVYTATITGGASGVKDLAGNALVNNFSWSFTTADIVPPTVSSTIPANSAVNVPANGSIAAIFSEAVNAATVTTGTFQLRDAGNNLVTATVSASGNQITLTPSSTLSGSTVYTATITGGASGVKDLAGNALANNYSWTFTTGTVDITPPTVGSVSPANGTANVATNSVVTATFSETVNASTVTTATFQLRDAANTLVPAVVSASGNQITLAPASALGSAITYTATITGGASGVKDLAGNALASNYSWSFTTADVIAPTVSSTTPSNGAANVNAGTTIVTVFSEAINPATVTTTTYQLRDAGNNLVTATVSASGNQITLTPSSTLASSVTYTATITGGASGVKDLAGNALASNYSWTFTTADIIPPTVNSVSPVNGATNVPLITTVTATFSEPLNVSTVTGSTVQLRDAGNNLVSATVTGSGSQVTLTPLASLAGSTIYTATIAGGSSGVKDLDGNALVSNYSWSFTTTSASSYTVFQPNNTPSIPRDNDGTSIELGMKFRANQTGFVTGVRYYKGSGTTGTHIGNLWTSTGTKLATVTFTGETSSGWQQALFTTPVAITANTTYVVSYFSPSGDYATTNPYFTQATVNGPLRGLANGEDGPNGLYRYTNTSAFPNNNWLTSNYWVDVVFISSGPDNTPPVVTSVAPLNAAANINVNTTVTITFSEALNASSVTSSTVQLRDASNNVVASSLATNSSQVILTPNAALLGSTTYTLTVSGGSSGVKDLAGNALVNNFTSVFTTGTPPPPPPSDGPGGPILVVSTGTNPYTRYTAEILRAEGMNAYFVRDISQITANELNNYDVAILGEMNLSSSQSTMFSDWVNAGGTLIAFRPSTQLSSLLGITKVSGTLDDKYLLINTASGPGAGIVSQTIQYHGTSDLYTLNGAASLATLYSSAGTATTNPAITTRNVGSNGGRAIAFTFDLPRSIVYTRQGNPAWAGQKRDGEDGPIRSDDMFFGGTSPDWIDFNKVAIPQADEQQRLLVNIILQGNMHRKPLPRLWYLPRGLKAAIVMTGDDHGNNGTEGRFNQYLTLGPNTAQDIADWKAIRGTSYIYPGTPLSNSKASAFQAQGFEIALHPTTNCEDFSLSSLQTTFTDQLDDLATQFPGLTPPVTNRTHCLAWSDWSSHPKVEYQNGIRLDANYYYWPQAWMHNFPGMFTGSGMPMRFADTDGSLIDVYQLTTQMTDETNMNYTSFCNALLDKAVGPEGYYGVFNANMHTDFASHAGSDAIIASAQAHQVPVIAAKQMLTWLDGRNNSYFGNISWSNNQLSFSMNVASGGRNMKGMVPVSTGSATLVSISMNGSSVTYTTQTIKGMNYAFFDAPLGTNNFVAVYANTGSSANTNSYLNGRTTLTADGRIQSENGDESSLRVQAMPNPFNHQVTLEFSSDSKKPVNIRIVDMFGRTIRSYDQQSPNGRLDFGLEFASGVYFAEVRQGSQTRVIKLIKAN